MTGNGVLADGKSQPFYRHAQPVTIQVIPHDGRLLSLEIHSNRPDTRDP